MKHVARTAAQVSTLPTPSRDHIQGPIDAPIKLVEYGDYECPYCGEAFPVVKAIQQRLGNRLCFAFRNFPLTNMHTHAEHAAEAAEAANEQERFWEMHDLLYEHQDSLEDEDLAQYASDLGLDTPRLISEVQAEAHASRIREDFRSGARNGVNGTPTFFINGMRYDGPVDLESMTAYLARAADT
jgi:formate-nitrite transporter family protein